MNLAEVVAMVMVLKEKIAHLDEREQVVHDGEDFFSDLASRVSKLEEHQQITENHPPPPAATTVSPGSTAWVISEDDTDDPQVLRAMIKQLKKEAEQQMKKCEELQATLLSMARNSASAWNSASAAADTTAEATTLHPPGIPQPAPQPAPQPSAAAAGSATRPRSAEQLAGWRGQSSPQQQRQQHPSGSTTTAAAPAATCQKLSVIIECEDCTLFLIIFF